jgi:hypothetical protein
MLAEWFVDLLAGYSVLGVLFAFAFVIAGVQRMDSQARGSGFGFRVLIFPGTVAFWPMLLRRWLRGWKTP